MNIKKKKQTKEKRCQRWTSSDKFSGSAHEVYLNEGASFQVHFLSKQCESDPACNTMAMPQKLDAFNTQNCPAEYK